MSIFRAYDIRGVYPGQLNGEIAFKVGLAFGKFIGGGTIALGMDARKSGPDLHGNLLTGLTKAGLNVIDVGMVPTPVLYFTVASGGLDGGVMITGSHNPKEYNGIKLCGKKGICLSYETGIGEVEEIVKAGVFSKKPAGKLAKKDVKDEYASFILKMSKLERPLSVVIDAGNGVAGKIASAIFRRLGCDVTELHCEPDGDFPNHHPDPLERENLRSLQAKVKETGADLGVAYDGDGDRVGFVNERGDAIPNNIAFALLIENVLGKNPGAKVIHEVLASKLVEDVIISMGGKPVLSKVGHSYIQEKMVKDDCVLGGETSGHYYFKESYKYDDGILASVKMAELLAATRKGMSELGGSLPKYLTSDDTRIHCPDESKFEVVERLKKKFEGQGRIIAMDGVKVVLKDSWFIVRASNTQPALVLRWEAKDEKEFRRLEAFVRSEVEKEVKLVS
jgi:phosphomannomutase/phosphoglucomutase